MDEIDELPDRHIDKTQFLQRFAKFEPPMKALIVRRFIQLKKPFTRFAQPPENIIHQSQPEPPEQPPEPENREEEGEEVLEEEHLDDDVSAQSGDDKEKKENQRKRYLEAFENTLGPVDEVKAASVQPRKKVKVESLIIERKTYTKHGRKMFSNYKEWK